MSSRKRGEDPQIDVRISVLKCSVSSSVEASELEAGSDTIPKVPITELNKSWWVNKNRQWGGSRTLIANKSTGRRAGQLLVVFGNNRNPDRCNQKI